MFHLVGFVMHVERNHDPAQSEYRVLVQYEVRTRDEHDSKLIARRKTRVPQASCDPTYLSKKLLKSEFLAAKNYGSLVGGILDPPEQMRRNIWHSTTHSALRSASIVSKTDDDKSEYYSLELTLSNEWDEHFC